MRVLKVFSNQGLFAPAEARAGPVGGGERPARVYLKRVPLHPLPQHLSDMLRRASRKELPDLTDQGLNTPEGVNFYALAWGVLYFVSGDHEHALTRLERVYQVLGEGVKIPVAEPEEEPGALPVVYEIPKGAKSKLCGCGTRIWFVKTPAGERMPVTQDGVSHFATCPDAGKHSRKKRVVKEPAP